MLRDDLTEALENMVGCPEFLYSRGPQNDTKYRIEGRFKVRFLSNHFISKGIKVIGVSENQISNGS